MDEEFNCQRPSAVQQFYPPSTAFEKMTFQPYFSKINGVTM